MTAVVLSGTPFCTAFSSSLCCCCSVTNHTHTHTEFLYLSWFFRAAHTLPHSRDFSGRVNNLLSNAGCIPRALGVLGSMTISATTHHEGGRDGTDRWDTVSRCQPEREREALCMIQQPMSLISSLMRQQRLCCGGMAIFHQHILLLEWEEENSPTFLLLMLMMGI